MRAPRASSCGELLLGQDVALREILPVERQIRVVIRVAQQRLAEAPFEPRALAVEPRLRLALRVEAAALRLIVRQLRIRRVEHTIALFAHAQTAIDVVER